MALTRDARRCGPPNPHASFGVNGCPSAAAQRGVILLLICLRAFLESDYFPVAGVLECVVETVYRDKMLILLKISDVVIANELSLVQYENALAKGLDQRHVVTDQYLRDF